MLELREVVLEFATGGIDTPFLSIILSIQATFEGWMELMRAASDVPSDADNNASREQNYAWNAFFLVFIVFGSFFTLNLFIGVIIDNFNMLKKKVSPRTLHSLILGSKCLNLNKVRILLL